MSARSLSLILAAATLAVPAGAATICVNTGGTGGCQSMIQAAVGLASPGDTIKVAAGTYLENVTIPTGKSGLIVQGPKLGGAIVDPDMPNTGAAFTVQSDNVSIKHLAIQNGQSFGIDVQGNGAIVNDVKFVGMVDNGVEVESGFTGAQIMNSTFYSVSTNIHFAGGNTNSTVSGNTSFGGNLFLSASSVASTGVQVQSNTQSWGDFGFQILGDTATVSGNTFNNVLGPFNVSGKNPVADSNVMVGGGASPVGVTCSSCTGGSMSNNKLTNVFIGPQVSASAAGFVVNSNSITRALIALSISGTGISASQNAASGGVGAIAPACVAVGGAGHTLTNNSVRCATTAFLVSGASTVTLSGNTALSAGTNGFAVSGGTGNTLANNTAQSVAGEGFAVYNSATGTTLTGNKVVKARYSYCDDTGASSASGNTFPTTSTTCDVLQ